MIQKVLRCTLGIFSGNIYFDIANKPDRRVWLVCCSTEWAWRKSAFIDGCQLGYPYIFPTMIFLLKMLIWFEYTASQGGCLYG